jgi:hypothetical protein
MGWAASSQGSAGGGPMKSAASAGPADSPISENSMRRLDSRPASVSLEAMGFASP